MPRFPGYGFPFQYYSPYRKNNHYNNYNHHTPPITPVMHPKEISHPPHPPQPPKPTKSADPVWFNLFGIKLYFDDVLILSLLFFLYKEEVKDEGLFLALILLLIS